MKAATFATSAPAGPFRFVLGSCNWSRGGLIRIGDAQASWTGIRDLVAATARFLRSEEATEPPVAELADAPKRRWCGSAEPDVERFERSRFDVGGTDREIVA